MRRPRIKFEHSPIRYGDGRVRIGGIIIGIAADIPDPDGSVWALLELLDGSRTVDQVVADLVHRFPARSENDIRTAITGLADAGFLEDAGEPTPPGLTERARERHGRSRALFQWMDLTPRQTSWEAQLHLHQARVVLVGLGGVGSTAALALTASGIGQLHCVEPDLVELSNLNRQILYTEADLGQAKVNVAVQRLREYNSEIAVSGERTRIDGPDALRALATGCDVLMLAADQPKEIRSWTNQACRATGTAWVHGGYHGPQVNIGLYQPGTGPCYDCYRAAERERRAGLPPQTFWPPAVGAAGTHAANAVTAGIAGDLAAHAAMSLITGAPKLRINCQFGLNLVTLDHSFAVGPEQPRSDCPACGHGTG